MSLDHSLIYPRTMLRLTRKGTYNLTKYEGQTKILSLDKKKKFIIMDNDKIVYIPSSVIKNGSDGLLSSGAYRLYLVKNEATLSDALHLELLTSEGKCKSFLLPAGLPTGRRTTRIILPTTEVISRTIN